MPEFIKFIKREDVQLFATLAFLILIIIWFKSMISLALLTVIFSYLAVKMSLKLSQLSRLPHVISVIVVYGLVLVALYTAARFTAPTLIEQFARLPKAVMSGLEQYPDVQKYCSKWIEKFNFNKELLNNWKSLLSQGIATFSIFSGAIVKVLLAALMSFIFTVTYPKITLFGRKFLTSTYPKFFKNIYFLVAKFIDHLGKIIETQIKIDLINCILMVIGFNLLGMPSPFVLGIIVLILGLVPVAGVLISMIPLSIMAFSQGGLSLFIAVVILVLVVHLFESYFLHPRMMASRAQLPIFVTLVTLLVMEHFLGMWGLIVGVPIVAFTLDLLGVQTFDEATSEKEH